MLKGRPPASLNDGPAFGRLLYAPEAFYVDLLLVRDFECQLDSTLSTLPSVLKGGNGAISLSAKLIEEGYAQKKYGIVEHLKTGLEVLARISSAVTTQKSLISRGSCKI